MEKAFRNFLDSYYQTGDLLLLALSGGPDSMALFDLLLQHAISFHVAHIDHGWREESKKEANTLKSLCDDKKIPFHLKVLNMEGEKADLEAKARECRLLFYRELVQKYSFKAVCLAHHADDQVETVLKRIFEGASLPHLAGMQEVSRQGELNIWRPLLKVSKNELIAYLEDRKIPYFVDKTNKDPRFLRSRFREEILPYLNRQFGKNIQSSLLRLADQAKDLDVFVRRKGEDLNAKAQKGPFGTTWDFREAHIETQFEWKLTVKHLLEKERLYPTAQTLAQIVYHLQKQSPSKKISIGKTIIFCNKGSLFLPV